MATLEEKITEAFTRQMRQYLEEVQKMVRVTLLEPYTGNSDGIVTMRYGSTEARVMGQGPDDAEIIDLTQKPRKIIPGRPIHYHLSFEEQKDIRCMGPHGCQDEPFDINKTIIMPLPAAMIYFGQWTKFDKVYAAGEQPDTYDTLQHQKKLVAAQWGGFKKRHRSMANYVANDWRSLESVGIPNIPNVRLERLDTQLRKIPNSAFEPWKVYEFHKDVVPDRWSENPNDKIIAVTASQMQEMIAQAVAEQLARGNNLPQKAAVR